MHKPTSLSRTLRHNKTLKGLPPPSTISAGVAALSGRSMRRLNLHATDVVLLHHGKRVCAATAWPLATLPDEAVALDDATLSTLGLPHTLPSASPSTPRSGKKAARRRSGARTPTPRRNSQPDRALPASPTTAAAPTSYEVSVRTLNGREVRNAAEVTLQPPQDCLLRFDDEYIAMLITLLNRRVLVTGMTLPVSALGSIVHFQVRDLRMRDCASTDREDGEEADEPICARSDSDTRVRVAPAGRDTELVREKPVRVYDVVGGLAKQAQELLLLANCALVREGESGSRLEPRRRPRGALLYGAPGTGKTLLAMSTASELGAEVEVLCGPEVLGRLSGEAVREVDAIFSRARRKRPCVVVLDEVDAMAPRRDAPETEPVQRKTTAALLAILDGVEGAALDGVFVVGTSSRPDTIDPAMRRAGRFDREIELPIPSARGRGEILSVMTAKARREHRLLATNAELEKVANVCYGFVGADISALWRESVSIALQRGTSAPVTYDDMRHAMKQVKPSALREVAVEVPATRWSDIGGKEEAKQRLKEAVEWPLTSKGAALFKAIGVSPPRGILLFGPPGCSKTLLARAVATESGANFISVKGAELLSKWVGESEKAVRSIFRRARQAAPCVVFFDEVDALAGARSTTAGASAQARVVAQLLAEMDGVDTNTTDTTRRVIVIAATNRPDCLDEAFVRPGRIDAQVYVGLPNAEERLAILKVHSRAVPLGEDVDLEHIAEDGVTDGFSGAEVTALVREAALIAMERDVESASVVCKDDFDEALTRVQPRTPPRVIQYFEEYVQGLSVGSNLLKRGNSLFQKLK